MAGSIKPSQLKDSTERQKLSKNMEIVTIDGTSVNMATQPDTYAIKKAMAKANPITANDSISLNEQATMVLGTMGCAVSAETETFSLTATCGDTETIDNENILDLSSYENTTAGTVSATDKFSSDSAFYNLDDDLPTTYLKRNEAVAATNQADVVSLAAALFNGTTSTTTSNPPASEGTTTTGTLTTTNNNY